MMYSKRLWSKDACDKAIWHTKKFWKQYQYEVPLSSLYNSQLIQKDSSTTQRSLDSFDHLEAELQGKYVRPGSQDELDNYLAKVSYSLKIEDPIQWWLDKDQTKQWPQLLIFAVNILSIPAMSAKPEMIFSGGRCTIDWERVQLGVETFKMVECEKDWIHSNILQSSF
jgi:hAT family C-terminal dimerisation region